MFNFDCLQSSKPGQWNGLEVFIKHLNYQHFNTLYKQWICTSRLNGVISIITVIRSGNTMLKATRANSLFWAHN